MNDINKEIKKIVKETTKNIVNELDSNDWFISSSIGDIDYYRKELKTIIKKACKDVAQNGYKKGMTKDVIKETVDIANEAISRSISLYDDDYYSSYKSNLKPYIKEALKSCDKLHESEREKRKLKTYSIIEEIKSRPDHIPGRVIFSSTENQQAENTRENHKSEQNENHNFNTTSDGVIEEYFGIFSNVIDYGSLDADQIGMDEEYEL